MRRGLLFVAFALAATACSSSSGGGPNLNASMPLVDLSSSDQKTLCDWWAAQYGGYGKSKSCGGGPIVMQDPGPVDQATCVAGLPQKSTSSTCGATVGNRTGCVQWRVASNANGVPNGCGSSTQPLDCNALNDSRCH
jgi:hypothetical protein